MPENLTEWFITNWKEIFSEIKGVLGVIIGAWLNEHFRRKQRESLFAQGIFDKKIKIYEKLYNNSLRAHSEWYTIMDKKNLSKKEKERDWESQIILPNLEFLDKNALYIDEDLSSHYSLTLLGADKFFNPKHNSEKNRIKFVSNWKRTTEMIKNYSGLSRLDKFFNKINRGRVKSEYVDAYEIIKKSKTRD